MPFDKWIIISGFAAAGGALFSLLQLPLPWLLGAVCFSFIWKWSTKQDIDAPDFFKPAAFILLGTYFALYLHSDTLIKTIPILPVYLPLSLMMIVLSLLLGLLMASRFHMNKKTSMLGLVPGAQSAVLMISEKHGGRTALIMLLHSIRRLLVLVSLPVLVLLFSADTSASASLELFRQEDQNASYWWYVIPALALTAGFLHKSLLLPAAPLAMGLLVLSGFQPAPYPESVLAAAQLLLGMYIGLRLKRKDLSSSKKHALPFTAFALLFIALSVAAGLLLSLLTPLDRLSGVMSMTPGGLLETGFAASEAGGNPVSVIMLQLIRFLLVFYTLPLLIGWYLRRLP
ncbi:AbrB family transcriptional regulator [Alkalicoccus luteus]|uniref:AbrB family transcriptional regulator n=1 Tax=Alkalicoccus luteus TaxID=1237094 RepID=A0A969TS69_9BACI|nr:AbrB family transcriptional regulator [Alkalicoccus luteus]